MIPYVHAAATLYLTGLVWFVQVVHYPLMEFVGKTNFQRYERDHVRRSNWVITPVLFVELITALVLLNTRRDALALSGIVLLALLWLSTAFIQFPAHQKLMNGYDEKLQRSLVRSNWFRTALWSARSVIALWIVAQPA